ncbi:MAG: redoxin domain-containing protein [Rhodopseudomonas sp.]|uniref:redoxin domain-containing protein n=1 Tax=Rhodopseudomonas sp. TaxID=1078 RepID=UPI0017BF5A04|nr:redoxin domain-containing protein [Rhodopseudomonas sp.]NVN86114.1 redoxin domain-containing protein [Rhodopseudomonas sp.]
MSKQTRKKTSKPATAKKAVAKAKAPVKRVAPKASAKVADKLSKKPAKASHKPKSKTLSASKPAAKPAVKVAVPATKRGAAKSPAATKPRPQQIAAIEPGIAAELSEGSKAPSFALPRDGGEIVKLADYSGTKLVIFFYPRAATPGCTREAIDFTRLASDFAACGTQVIGVSADPLKAQESFRDKHQLATPLISDEAHQMLQAYGAWGEKSMYGKTFEGVLRTTVLIGRNGRIAKIWRGVKVDGHADEVLAVAQKL